MKNIRRSKRGFTLVELMVVITIIGILAAVGTPAMMIALDKARKNSDVQNIRQLGIALLAAASDSDDQRYPSNNTGGTLAGTSTDVFQNLLTLRIIPTADLVFSPGASKVKYTDSSQPLNTINVGYCYTIATISTAAGGVSMADDEGVPLLYSAGNSPITVATKGQSLSLLASGIWKQTGTTVYYKGNNAKFLPVTSAATVKNFVPQTFVKNTDITYAELKP